MLDKITDLPYPWARLPSQCVAIEIPFANGATAGDYFFAENSIVSDNAIVGITIPPVTLGTTLTAKSGTVFPTAAEFTSMYLSLVDRQFTRIDALNLRHFYPAANTIETPVGLLFDRPIRVDLTQSKITYRSATPIAAARAVQFNMWYITPEQYNLWARVMVQRLAALGLTKAEVERFAPAF